MNQQFCGVSDEAEARDELPAEERLSEAYDRVLALARAVPVNEIKTFGVDTRLAFWNAREGFKIISPHFDEIRTLPRVDADAIERIPDMAMALLHAVRTISLLDPPKSNLSERLARARRLRYVMLHQAQAAAGLGLLPEGPVERIYKGKGAIDAVEDLTALATLYEQHRASLVGKTVVTDELIIEAERLGLALQEELRPSAVKRPPQQKGEQLERAIDDRNRLYTLLATAHAELTRVAGFFELKVPALQSRRVVKKKVAEATEA